MTLEIETKNLVDYIKSLGLNIPEREPSHEHVGAIIADAVLQVGHRWKKQVKPRVERIRDKYPSAQTISGISPLLKSQGAQIILDWAGEDEQVRFQQSVDFFKKENINTFENLRNWLRVGSNRDRLVTKSNRVDNAGIAKIGNATADYYCVLVRLPDAVKIDSRVKKFLTNAGISVQMYQYKELRTIVQTAAKQLRKRAIDLDGAIWNYGEKENKEAREIWQEKSTSRETAGIKLWKRPGTSLQRNL